MGAFRIGDVAGWFGRPPRRVCRKIRHATKHDAEHQVVSLRQQGTDPRPDTLGTYLCRACDYRWWHVGHGIREEGGFWMIRDCVWCGGIFEVEDGCCRVCGRSKLQGWTDLAAFYGYEASLRILREEDALARHYGELAAHAAGKVVELLEAKAT